MTRLLVATRSRGKQRELRAMLRPLDCELVFPDDLDISESIEESALEAFDTFEANATAKVHWFARRTGMLTLADDSGLEVDALDGAPGVRSKRFAGVDGADEEVAPINNAMLLARLAALGPGAARTARYHCVLVLSRPTVTGFEDRIVSGVTEGKILESPRGSGGFGYDPLFWSGDLQMTFGEAASGAKAAVSHRGRAVAALIGRWHARLGNSARGRPA